MRSTWVRRAHTAREERRALEEVRRLTLRQSLPTDPNAWAAFPSREAEVLWAERLRIEKDFDEKIKAVKSYDGAMEKIAKAHTELFNNRAKVGEA